MICNITTYPKPGAGNVEVVLGMAGFISRVKDNAGISTVDKTNITAGQEVNKITELVVTKEWKHSYYKTPSVPRDKHVSMDGEKVDINDEFSIGFDPRDTTETSEVWNCGCGMVIEYAGNDLTAQDVLIVPKPQQK